jgi:hypothetical protein
MEELNRMSIPYDGPLFAPVTEADLEAADKRFKEAAAAAAAENMEERKRIEEEEKKAREKKEAAIVKRAKQLKAAEEAAAARAEEKAKEAQRLAEEERLAKEKYMKEEAERQAEEEKAKEAQRLAKAAEEAAKVSNGDHEPEKSNIKNLEELHENEKLKIEIKLKDFNEAFKIAIRIFKKYIENNSLKDKKLFDIVVLDDNDTFYIPKTDIEIYNYNKNYKEDNKCEQNLIISCIEYIHFLIGQLLYGDKESKYAGDILKIPVGFATLKTPAIGFIKKDANLLDRIEKDASSLKGFLKFLDIKNYYSMEKDSILSTFNSIETLS